MFFYMVWVTVFLCDSHVWCLFLFFFLTSWVLTKSLLTIPLNLLQWSASPFTCLKISGPQSSALALFFFLCACLLSLWPYQCPLNSHLHQSWPLPGVTYNLLPTPVCDRGGPAHLVRLPSFSPKGLNRLLCPGYWGHTRQVIFLFTPLGGPGCLSVSLILGTLWCPEFASLLSCR